MSDRTRPLGRAPFAAKNRQDGRFFFLRCRNCLSSSCRRWTFGWPLENRRCCVFRRVAPRILRQVRALRKQAERTRAETLLSLGGDLSSSNCYLELQAGAGGTESHDWTSMLFTMYTRSAESRGVTREPLFMRSPSTSRWAIRSPYTSSSESA